jgi:SAM-dependent methyltransferase
VCADARALPLAARTFDAVVSGAALNFLPVVPQALAAMAELVVPGGTVAAYVWDFGGEMQPHRRFWDAVLALDPAAARFDQATKFPLCRPGGLEAAFVAAGLRQVVSTTLDVPAVFRDFDDLWLPFVTGEGSVVDYTRSLSPPLLEALRERVRLSVAADAAGRIRMTARAFAARGVVSRGRSGRLHSTLRPDG